MTKLIDCNLNTEKLYKLICAHWNDKKDDPNFWSGFRNGLYLFEDKHNTVKSITNDLDILCDISIHIRESPE